MQTEPQIQRQERTEQLEAKIEQHKEYIRRGNMVNQDLRKTISDLRDECEQRQWRQEKTDHELGRRQQMIEELSQELREVRIQAAAARGSLAGIPRTVFMSKKKGDITCTRLQWTQQLQWSARIRLLQFLRRKGDVPTG